MHDATRVIAALMDNLTDEERRIVVDELEEFFFPDTESTEAS
jgi:hypothetical protein